MPTIYPVTFTLGALKTRILRVVGKQNSTDAQTEAGEVIRSLIDEFNTRIDWKFLRAVSTYNVTTDGLLTLNVTASPQIKKIYSVITADRPLKYLPLRDFNLQNPAGLSIGGTYYYTAFSVGQTSVVKIIDPPASSLNVTVNYQMLATMPATDNDSFTDLPSPVGNWLFCAGRAAILGSMGGDPDKVSFWDKRANKAEADLNIYDSTFFPDHITQFIPADAVAENYDNPYYEWDTY